MLPSDKNAARLSCGKAPLTEQKTTCHGSLFNGFITTTILACVLSTNRRESSMQLYDLD